MLGTFRNTLSFVVLALPLACTPATPDPTPQDNFDRVKMLENLSDNVIVPALTLFRDDAQSLVSAANAFEANPSDQTRAALQGAWTTAMVSWQRAEVYQVGPAGAAGIATAGEGLRDEIYSWPQQNFCAIDQQIVSQGYNEPNFLDATLVDAYGLDALEYLVFADRQENACSGTATINRDGSWNALDETQRATRAAAYSVRVAQSVLDSADLLIERWNSTFSQEFKNGAGEFQNAQAVIDEVFAALYYLELRVKDKKLAVPLGLHIDCRADTCPESVESAIANTSLQNIAENLRAGRALLTGDVGESQDALGFDDFLVELEAPEVASEMVATLDAAITLIDAQEVPLSTLIQSDPDAARAIYESIKSFTDIMKSDFVTVLNLRVPQEGAGDND